MKICEHCGVSSSSQVIHGHHVVGRVGKDKHKPENLINLCVMCHHVWHNYRTPEYEEFMYKYMKSKFGSEFPIKVNGKPYKTKWIMRVENMLK